MHQTSQLMPLLLQSSILTLRLYKEEYKYNIFSETLLSKAYLALIRRNAEKWSPNLTHLSAGGFAAIADGANKLLIGCFGTSRDLY
ncbi:hypothetical protein ACJX0J_020473, partial [Zea mays]